MTPLLTDGGQLMMDNIRFLTFWRGEESQSIVDNSRGFSLGTGSGCHLKGDKQSRECTEWEEWDKRESWREREERREWGCSRGGVS
jgi:hypothetical protein